MRFFVTLKEKLFIIRQLKRGDGVPFLKYCMYRARLSRYFFLTREHYRMRVWYAPYAFWLWTHQDKVREDELFFSKFLKEGDVVVDAGAHLGTLTMTASAHVGKTGKVIACEPHPKTFFYLQQNIQDNHCSNVELHAVALGDATGVMRMTSQYVSDMNHIDEHGSISVRITTLDELLKHEPKITILKLDVEGCELQALRGARKTLAKTDVVYFESAPQSFQDMGYTLADIISLLKEHGFTTYKHDSVFSLGELSCDHTTKERYENLVAVKDVHLYSTRITETSFPIS